MRDNDATSGKPDLVALAACAPDDWDALLRVVERFPVLTGGRDPRETRENRERQRELIRLLTPCTPGLIRILETLPEKLAHPDDTTYDWCIRAGLAAFVLGEIGAPAEAAVPALIRAMHADQRGVGQFAGPALGEIGGEEAIRELNRVWFSGWDRKLCGGIDWALEHLGSRAYPVLLQIVQEPDALARARALHSLRRAGYPAADLVWLIAGLMQNEQPAHVKEQAACILADALHYLDLGASDLDARARDCAARELAKTGGRAAIEALLAAVPGDPEQTAPAVARALLQLLDETAVELLTFALASADTELREGAVRGVGGLETSWSEAASALPTDGVLGTTEAAGVRTLFQAIRRKENLLRRLCAATPLEERTAFCQYEPIAARGTVERLTPYLRHQEAGMRAAAARALARFRRDDRAFEPLKNALADDDAEVRAEVVRAFGSLGFSGTAAIILPLLSDADRNVRWEALDALGNLGSREVIGSLEKVASTDPDDEIRARAALHAKRLRNRTETADSNRVG